jgi:hypothetical protein
MRKNNYFKLISIITIAMLLLPIGLSFAQQGSARQVTLVGMKWRIAGNEAADAHYATVVAPQFDDSDDNSFFWDPSGESILDALTVEQGIFFFDDNFGTMTITGTGAARGSVDFNGISGNAEFTNCQAVKFVMHDDGPPSFRDGGKYVYDIAELIDVEAADICDVVVISKEKDLAVTRSTTKFDTKVAGVISEAPKIVMGHDTEQKPLALAGIVKCNVTTENGPVKRGDMLVSSSLPGYAMRASADEVSPGMVVGSALDSLDEGKGKIYILVNQ